MKTNTPQLENPSKKNSFIINDKNKIFENRTYLITGLERGGTSMVAGVCRALGLNMGERNGLNHEDPSFITDSSRKLKERIKLNNEDKLVWGFKSPKASVNLKFFEKNLRNPHFIFVYRNSLSIADSWINRNSGSMDFVLKRILEYHTAQLKLLKNSKNPFLLINYERSVASKNAKVELIETLNNFLKLSSSSRMKNNALKMITGDGGGYLNLIEEHFYVKKISSIPKSNEMKFEKKLNPHVTLENNENLKYNNVTPGEIYRLVGKKKLPKKFYLEINFQSSDYFAFDELPIRIFFNFTGKRHPGHCTRPLFNFGINKFYVETSGKALDLSIGIVHPPKKVKFKLKFFK